MTVSNADIFTLRNGAPIRVAVLIAAHNRRETTIRCLEALYTASSGHYDLDVYLVDDGSGDGTSQAVRAQFPQVRLLHGDGQLYWNGAMLLAWSTALAAGPDLYLWLNDDTVLRPAALGELIALYASEASCNRKTIIVGRTVSRHGETTYGGYVRATGLSRLRFRRLTKSESVCDTFNGNCVLIPSVATEDIGLISSRYRHAFGDNDYGLRARRAGYRIIEMNSPVALQEKNEIYARAANTLTFSNWRFILFHPKGVPALEWYSFCRRHGGPLWPVNFLYRYFKMAARGLGR
jgi:GT2 family glycosyltransferase